MPGFAHLLDSESGLFSDVERALPERIQGIENAPFG
jgi:hypothetical protein